MNIRTRLAVQFSLLASCILGISFLVVYFRAVEFRKEEFLTRLYARGLNAANLLIQVDEVSDRLLHQIEINSPVRLPEEAISIFNERDSLVFLLGDPLLKPTTDILISIRSTGTIERSIGERELYGFTFNDDAERFVVIASGHDRFGRRKLNDLTQVMLVTYLIGLVLIFLVGRVFARRALSPIQHLVGELQEISASDLSNRVGVGNGTDELAQLATSFNALLERLQGAFATQKNFIANASHEMRNPLTAISGQIDVLLLRSRSEVEYETALRSVQEDLRTVNRLNDRLLLMAQAETEATVMSFNPVRVDELVWSARDEVMRMNSAYGVDVKITDVENDIDLLLNGNDVLLRSMITNLLENACKYSPDHHAIVWIVGSVDSVILRVEDNGPGISPVEQERVFEHFFRTRNTGGAQGHGIGLALVKRIAELHGGKVTIESEVGKGAIFSVFFPKVA